MNSNEIAFGVSILIAVLGTITNSLSLSFFIGLLSSRSSPGHERNNYGRSTTKLFAALNLLDLMVCVSSTFVVLNFVIFKDEGLLMHALATVLRTLLFGTAFLTSLLAVLRAINLTFRLYVIKWKIVIFSTVIYLVILIVSLSVYLILFIIYPEIFHSQLCKMIFSNFEVFILVSTFLVIVLANAISLESIYFSDLQTTRWKRKATITVAILSAFYCICNIGYVVILCVVTYYHKSLEAPVSQELIIIFYFIFLSLNSACNPVIYLTRRADMRSYVATLWEKLTGGLLCGNESGESEDVSSVAERVVVMKSTDC